ncbi:DUF2971 domain-containing protein [Clostridium perfringens]|uniref:DUF2971 domain-containing protein n=1 Tax=Clostridium perfringens TaxID=1502 RepID=UPI0030D24CF3
MREDLICNEDNLYHFTNLESLIKILLTEEFLLSNIRNVNDYGEFFDDYDLIAVEEFKKKNNIKENEWKYILDKEYHEAQQKDLDRIKQVSKRVSSIYMACFTYLSPKENIWDKPSLWGTYADRGNGVCIVFDKGKLDKLFNNSFQNEKFFMINGKISYLIGSDYKKITKHLVNYFDGDMNKFVKEKYLIKNKEWSVEQEYRYLVYPKELSEKNEMFLKLKNILPTIKGVIVGDKVVKYQFDLIKKVKDKLLPNSRFISMSCLEQPDKFVDLLK